MTEQGVVKKKKRNVAYVELKKNEKCEGCKLCAFGRGGTIVRPAVCELPAKAGDRVSVQMPERDGGNAALLIYALPILGLVVGAAIGLVGAWWLQLILAAVGLVIGLALIVPIERAFRKKSGVLPVVTAILDIHENNGQTEDNNSGA